MIGLRLLLLLLISVHPTHLTSPLLRPSLLFSRLTKFPKKCHRGEDDLAIIMTDFYFTEIFRAICLRLSMGLRNRFGTAIVTALGLFGGVVCTLRFGFLLDGLGGGGGLLNENDTCLGLEGEVSVEV